MSDSIPVHGTCDARFNNVMDLFQHRFDTGEEIGAAVCGRLRGGTTFGYLAYVDGRPVGWVNASFRSDYGLFRLVDGGGPEPRSVIGVSCFIIAPPFQWHGVASWIEGYV